MNKICQWQQGELITHTKLNNTVDIINSMLDNFQVNGSNVNIIENTSIGNNGTGGFFNTMPWNETTLPAAAQDAHHKMWDADGEGIVLGWDKDRLITCTAGVYVRNNGLYFPFHDWQGYRYEHEENGAEFNSLYWPENCQIKILKPLESNTLDGARIWQKISIYCSDISCGENGQVRAFQTSMEIHDPDWNPTWKRWSLEHGGYFYRPMSRITTSCATDTCAALDYKVESIATNDTMIWPLPLPQNHIDMCVGDLDNERADQGISTLPDLESIHSPYMLKFATLMNKGGLKFSDPSVSGEVSAVSSYYPWMESGVEIYGYERKECGAGVCTRLREPYKLNTESVIPNLQEGVVACWPVKRRLMKYMCDTGFWCCDGTSDAGSIKLSVIKPCNNSWQFGFVGDGCIAFEYYSGLKPSGGEGGCGEIVVKEHICGDNWTDVTKTASGNKTIYEINTVPRVNSPLEIRGNGYISINLPQLNDCLTPYYPVLCESACCVKRIILNKQTQNGQTTYTPELPDWLLNQTPGTSYCFDREWFCIDSNNNVTVNINAINAVAAEALNELSLCLEVNGLVETTFKGQLEANGAGALSFNTDVHYV